MKSIFVFLSSLFIFSACPLSAYDRLETLVGGKTGAGAFIAPAAKYTMMNDKWGLMFGGRMALVVNHAFNIGAGYYGLADKTLKAETVNAAGEKLAHRLAYGGLEFEYVIDSDYLAHPTIVALLGAGSVGYEGDPAGLSNDDGSSFFVLEPGLNFELNVSRNVRAGLGIYYRMVTGVDSKTLSNSKTNGPSVSLSVKFGAF